MATNLERISYQSCEQVIHHNTAILQCHKPNQAVIGDRHRDRYAIGTQDTFRFPRYNCTGRIERGQYRQPLILLIRHIDLPSQRIIIHRTIRPTAEQHMHRSPLEIYRDNTALACGSIDYYARWSGKILRATCNSDMIDDLSRVDIENC